MFKRFVLIITGLVLMFMLSGCDFLDNLKTVDVVESDENTAPIEVRMLDVGQGLCILIKADDRYLVYDGGGRESSSYVAGYMRAHKIKNLDYLIASHFDEDHISGLIGIMNVCSADRILTPDYGCDSSISRSFRKCIDLADAKEEHPQAGDTYVLGSAQVEVVGPENYDASYENNRCIAIRITYGDFSCIITGDAEYEEETAMMDSGRRLRSTVYVAGHHGSSFSSSGPFLAEVCPEAAFISVGKNNRYGHPSEQTLERLEGDHIDIYRTDIDGEVTAYSDGDVVWFGKAQKKAVSVTGDTKGMYVINTRSKIFHDPSCSCVRDMSPYNTIYTDEPRKAILKDGYEPCGYCRP